MWLFTGLALLAVTIRAQWASPAPAPAAVAAALAPISAESARRVYQPSTSLASGEEIILVFIGASFCNAQKRAGFPTVVETAKVRLQAHANASGLRFRAIGVALDWRTADGLAFLARFGEFDEVMSGGNWTSDAATKYIWRDIPGDADVPQMLVLRRTVQTDQAIRIGEDQVVKRLRGVNDIEAWVASGAAL
ncbi:hypothetical protein [Longimicrobium terrae]|uniref:Redoxin domain-containing protein n=1 Tax=Longimicrobium terrae TaxID=1639882 RepID=A0A841GX52_9BACT|nr:hypothetical protein [Longimicrobium terrae]MBB4635002.1 hypothetical protein [Longimicrobium terrae]MBB6069396.1 hypothetical protein [Longimicrobium terrae]NNC31797.1 hypothetical protein [Longimicrobium terrae]